MSKVKRVLLVYDEEQNLSALRVVLESRGYRVFTCDDEAGRTALLRERPIDLQLIGPRMPCPLEGGVFVMQRYPDYSMLQMLEKLRIALIRRRGPKPRLAGAVGGRAVA